ncbi:MAG: PAS domain-containing protein [Polyangiales bacterium]
MAEPLVGTAEWFASVLNALDEFVLVKGDRSKLLWANRAFCEYYGMDNATLASLVDAEHSDPDDTLQYVRDDHEVWTTGKPVEVTEPVTRHDGVVRYYETIKRAVRDEGDTVLTVGISRPAGDADASESELSRLERKESSEVLRSLVATFPGNVVVVDAKQRIVAASRDFAELVEGSAESIRGQELEALFRVAPEQQDHVMAAASQTAEVSLNDVALLGHERFFDIRVAPWHLPGGQKVGMMMTLTEVTQLRASERRLAEERKALQSIIDLMEVGVATLDEEGGFALWNPAATRLTGVLPLRADIPDWGKLFGTYDQNGVLIPGETLPLARAFEGERVDHEVLMIRNEALGHERWLTVSAAPVKNVNGHAAVAVFTDITSRIEVQHELEQFAFVASHDLQEPLRMVQSYVGLLAEEYGDKLDEDAAQYMHFALDGANRMQNLIRDLLVFSRVGKRSLSYESTNLMDTLETVRRDLGSTLLETEGELHIEALPTLVADASQLVRLFENLVSNGLKFSRPGVAPKVDIRATEQGEYWRFEVEDNGIGIDPAYSDKVFNMFHRLNPMSRYPGTGIGLAICKRIVTRHGGAMGLGEKKGEGSLFWFTLPNKPV